MFTRSLKITLVLSTFALLTACGGSADIPIGEDPLVTDPTGTSPQEDAGNPGTDSSAMTAEGGSGVDAGTGSDTGTGMDTGTGSDSSISDSSSSDTGTSTVSDASPSDSGSDSSSTADAALPPIPDGGVCSPGQTGCQSNTFFGFCDNTGHWLEMFNYDRLCATPCTPGTTTCDLNNSQLTCDSSGYLNLTGGIYCPLACVAATGSCGGVCHSQVGGGSADTKCVDPTHKETCDSNGQWGPPTSCAGGNTGNHCGYLWDGTDAGTQGCQ